MAGFSPSPPIFSSFHSSFVLGNLGRPAVATVVMTDTSVQHFVMAIAVVEQLLKTRSGRARLVYLQHSMCHRSKLYSSHWMKNLFSSQLRRQFALCRKTLMVLYGLDGSTRTMSGPKWSSACVAPKKGGAVQNFFVCGRFVDSSQIRVT